MRVAIEIVRASRTGGANDRREIVRSSGGADVCDRIPRSEIVRSSVGVAAIDRRDSVREPSPVIGACLAITGRQALRGHRHLK